MPKHSSIFILLFLSSLILLSFFSGCLPVTPVTVTGTIYGYVAIPDDTTKDLTGYSPVPGATVTIVDADGVTHIVVTDENGYYCFNNISIKTNTIINITKDTEGGGKLIFKDIVPLAVSQEEDYDAGIADAESTAIALVVEGLVNLGQVQEEIDLNEITSSDGFDELKEDVQQAQEDNQDFTTDNPVNTQADEIADNIVNPPEPEPTPEPEPEPEPEPTPPSPPAATLSSIAITTPASKLSYSIDDALDITGLVVTGTYSDSTTKVETITTGNITGFDSSAPAANQVLTITVGGKTTTYTVNIVATPITAIGAITGTAKVGVELTAGALTPAGATATYRWQICTTSDGTYEDIAEATANTYTPVAGDATKFIKVVATGTGNYSGIVTSTATTAVENGDQAAPTGLEGVAPTTYGGTDGKITGTTTAMEYKLSTDETYTTATASPTTVGAAGTYNVRYAAKTGYNDGIVAVVVVPFMAIGSDYDGGKLAYILVDGDPGYIADEQHGLIAAAADQTPSDSGIQWYNGSYTTTGATGVVLGTGSANTTTIITSQDATATNYAAGLARAYNGGGYNDWFLPSKDELNKLWLNKVSIGGFADLGYWSSSEYNTIYAWRQYFGSGAQNYDNKGITYRVRAIRAF